MTSRLADAVITMDLEELKSFMQIAGVVTPEDDDPTSLVLQWLSRLNAFGIVPALTDASRHITMISIVNQENVSKVGSVLE